MAVPRVPLHVTIMFAEGAFRSPVGCSRQALFQIFTGARRRAVIRGKAPLRCPVFKRGFRRRTAGFRIPESVASRGLRFVKRWTCGPVPKRLVIASVPGLIPRTGGMIPVVPLEGSARSPLAVAVAVAPEWISSVVVRVVPWAGLIPVVSPMGFDYPQVPTDPVEIVTHPRTDSEPCGIV